PLSTEARDLLDLSHNPVVRIIPQRVAEERKIFWNAKKPLIFSFDWSTLIEKVGIVGAKAQIQEVAHDEQYACRKRKNHGKGTNYPAKRHT
ncbi:MAG: hypothetical protein LBP73_00995, partial [Clostridiales Family XIII bacterium]|nr:hypothetical protein [Clostridiales Family XIII bacterium]